MMTDPGRTMALQHNYEIARVLVHILQIDIDIHHTQVMLIFHMGSGARRYDFFVGWSVCIDGIFSLLLASDAMSFFSYPT